MFSPKVQQRGKGKGELLLPKVGVMYIRENVMFLKIFKERMEVLRILPTIKGRCCGKSVVMVLHSSKF